MTRGPLDEAALFLLAFAVYTGVCLAVTGRLPQ